MTEWILRAFAEPGIEGNNVELSRADFPPDALGRIYVLRLIDARTPYRFVRVKELRCRSDTRGNISVSDSLMASLGGVEAGKRLRLVELSPWMRLRSKLTTKHVAAIWSAASALATLILATRVPLAPISEAIGNAQSIMDRARHVDRPGDEANEVYALAQDEFAKLSDSVAVAGAFLTAISLVICGSSIAAAIVSWKGADKNIGH